MTQIILTANSRLTQTLKQQSLSGQVATVVRTPVIMTFAQWWSQWQDSCLLRGEMEEGQLPSKLLSAFEAQWLWEQVLQQEIDSRNQNDNLALVLLNLSSTAKQLYQAWSLLNGWLSEDLLDLHFSSAEVELFRSCKPAYLEQLQAKGWLDEVLAQPLRLRWLKEGKGKLPAQFELVGFDEITPEMQLWQTIVESRGCVVSVAPLQADTPLAAQQTIYAANDLQDEVQQVALWAIEQWQTLAQLKPLHQIKIGVVAPNLADYKVLLSQSLDEQLYQLGLQDLRSLENNKVPFYNLSLGQPLLGLPIVQNALLVLELFLVPAKPCRFQQWSQWLLSPYTPGSLVERQAVEARLRRLQWSEFKWPKLLEGDALQGLASKNDSEDKAQGKSVFALLRTQAKQNLASKLSLAEFVEAVLTTLQQMQWPKGRKLNSDDFQQKEALEKALTAFATLSALVNQQSPQAWLNVLKRFLAEQLHQSQSKGLQPIQIMGMLEAGGQTFDALWVLGLTDEAWPRMPSPNPFLPITLQRDKRLPRCDALRELDYARQVTLRLSGAAAQVVWSYPTHQGDAVLLPSPLLQLATLQDAIPYPPKVYQSMALLSLQHVAVTKKGGDSPERNVPQSSSAVEWVLDACGPQMAEGSHAPGGTGFLQAQSKCPLMAFIDYRLGARNGLQAVEEGLQNTNQGTLVHEILEHFWRETKTQSALLVLSDEALQDRLQNHIEQSFEALQGGFNQGYLAIEKSRILELCLQWLQLEKTRPPFAVFAMEQTHHISLQGIEFKVIIDRVDTVMGQKVILDYKTGKASINQLLNSPTKAPQLAVYLHAVPNEVVGIGYGLLHSDDGVKISALTADEDILQASRAISVFAKMADKEGGEYYQVAWTDFLDSLRQQVSDLALQIKQGYAAMTFEKPADIEYANGYLALRVPEVLQQMQNFDEGEA